jgi:hypothetical protein
VGDRAQGIAGGHGGSLRQAREIRDSDRVMQRANMVDTEHFKMIAKYLEERGWIAEADADYGVFVVTASGLDEATR